MSAQRIKAPFPYPGGKSTVADQVWARFGNVDNYVEPFMGSLAVLLRRPEEHFRNGYRVETCNDLNHFIVNFWRAVRNEPESVAEHADWPVMEADLHARHKWLMRSEYSAEWQQKMDEDPDHYDAKIAGWWVWGACCWIGSGWCEVRGTDSKQIALLSASGQGIHAGGRPQLADAYDIGRGVNGSGGLSKQIPQMLGQRGVVSNSTLNTCQARRDWLTDWMQRLSDRLRLVRTCYGHWSRICDSDSTMTRLGVTGVFLDPPYPIKTAKGKRSSGLYANDATQDLDGLRDEVLAWCIKWGRVDNVKIAVCGYEGDGYEQLVLGHGWDEVSWESQGGYGNQSGNKSTNAKRERIWYSPHCNMPQRTLFDHCKEVTA